MAANTQTIAAVALAVVSAVNVAGQSTRDRVTPDLTGAWVLNTDLSDKPGQMRGGNDDGSRGRSGPPPGRGGGGGGMGGPGRGGFGGGGGGREGMPNPEEMERMRAVMDAAMDMAARLTIVKGDQRLIVTNGEGASFRIPLDGSKDTGAANGAGFETTAKWENNTLRVERKFKSGLKLVEDYSLSEDPRQLTISSKIEGGRMPGGGRTLKRVYDSSAS